jgi:hypothetical protein
MYVEHTPDKISNATVLSPMLQQGVPFAYPITLRTRCYSCRLMFRLALFEKNKIYKYKYGDIWRRFFFFLNLKNEKMAVISHNCKSRTLMHCFLLHINLLCSNWFMWDNLEQTWGSQGQLRRHQTG